MSNAAQRRQPPPMTQADINKVMPRPSPSATFESVAIRQSCLRQRPCLHQQPGVCQQPGVRLRQQSPGPSPSAILRAGYSLLLHWEGRVASVVAQTSKSASFYASVACLAGWVPGEASSLTACATMAARNFSSFSKKPRGRLRGIEGAPATDSVVLRNVASFGVLGLKGITDVT
jgi:hypothetical protein